MNEDREYELQQEAQYIEQESQREQWISELQEANKQLQAENDGRKRWNSILCSTCVRRRESELCPKILPEEGDKCSQYYEADWSKIKQLKAKITELEKTIDTFERGITTFPKFYETAD